MREDKDKILSMFNDLFEIMDLELRFRIKKNIVIIFQAFIQTSNNFLSSGSLVAGLGYNSITYRKPYLRNTRVVKSSGFISSEECSWSEFFHAFFSSMNF